MAAALVVAHPNSARADISPVNLEVTLRPGETVHETKTVTVPRSIPKADVVFSMDLTGSMGGVLNTAKSQAINIMNQLDTLIADANYGVVSHMDYPHSYSNFFGYTASYGDPRCGDYAYRLDQPVTSSRTAVSNALNALSLACGADGPEAYSRVLFESYSDAGIGWRSGARRILIMFGDNLPHDNNINEGVPGKPGSLTTGGDPGRDELQNTADDIDLQANLAAMAANGVILFPVWSASGAMGYWSHWASLTGGEAILLHNVGDLPAAIQTLIENSAAQVHDLHLEVDPPAFGAWVHNMTPASYADLNTPATATFNFDITVPMGTAPGDYTFTVNAIGDGANFGTQTVLVHVLPLDENPPVTTHTFTGLAGDDGWWRSAVTTTLTATDDIGVAATYYTLDGGSANTYGGPFLISGDGPHGITYHSDDVNGNVESPEKSAGLLIDATPPATSISVTGTMGDNGWLVSPATVTVSSADAMSGVRNSFLDLFLVADGPGGYATYAGPVTVSTEGQHAANAYTRDVAGNEDAPVQSLFQIDLTPPVVSVGALSSQYAEGDTVTVSYSATDEVSGLATVGATLNGNPVADGGAVTLSAGTYTLVVTARDNAGHETTETRTFQVNMAATVHAHPRTLQKGNTGAPFTIHIDLPDPRTPAAIDCLTVMVDGVVLADCTHPGDGDMDGAGHGRLFMFDRAQIEAIAPLGDWTLVVTGTLSDGTPFKGTDTVRVTQH